MVSTAHRRVPPSFSRSRAAGAMSCEAPAAAYDPPPYRRSRGVAEQDCRNAPVRVVIAPAPFPTPTVTRDTRGRMRSPSTPFGGEGYVPSGRIDGGGTPSDRADPVRGAAGGTGRHRAGHATGAQRRQPSAREPRPAQGECDGSDGRPARGGGR